MKILEWTFVVLLALFISFYIIIPARGKVVTWKKIEKTYTLEEVKEISGCAYIDGANEGYDHCVSGYNTRDFDEWWKHRKGLITNWR